MSDCTQAQVVSVATTVASLEDARRLAALLLDRRLVACVQLEPGLESHYRWQGAVCQDAEVRVTAKTAPDRQQALLACLSQEHPYDLPQLLWQTFEADAAYARWVRDETR